MKRILSTTAKVVLGVTVSASTLAGVYEAPKAWAAHTTQPSQVSYASQSTIDRTVRLANHTPAKQGAFRSGADISDGDVVSVVRSVD